MKMCTRCKQEKPKGEFYGQKQKGSNGQVWDCTDSMCKICRNEYSSERRRDAKIKAIEYLGGKCVDCGLTEAHPSVYDFHHIDPTKKDFSIGKTTKIFETIKSELDKCILLCANCHRVRHV